MHIPLIATWWHSIFSPEVWDWADVGGLALVLVGVFGEVICGHRSFPFQKTGRRRKSLLEIFDGVHNPAKTTWEDNNRRWENRWGAMVIVGLGIELLALPHHFIEVGELKTAAKMLESTNLLLRVKVSELEIRANPRTIVPEQVTNFIFLTKETAKIPIMVSVGAEGPDTQTFAFQIRDMLSRAGFGVRPTNAPWGIMRDATRMIAREIGTTNDRTQVLFVLPSPDILEYGRTNWILYENTNGFLRPINASTNEVDVYTSLIFVFNQIGIRAKAAVMMWSGEKNYEIFVPLKEQF
jgi:hypothetical protein